MDPTEVQKETFRAAYKKFQESSAALGVAQKSLMETVRASSPVLSIGGQNGDPVTWDKSKVVAAAAALDTMSTHHQTVSAALQNQAAALRHVANLAGIILEAL